MYSDMNENKVNTEESEAVLNRESISPQESTEAQETVESEQKPAENTKCYYWETPAEPQPSKEDKKKKKEKKEKSAFGKVVLAICCCSSTIFSRTRRNLEMLDVAMLT